MRFSDKPMRKIKEEEHRPGKCRRFSDKPMRKINEEERRPDSARAFGAPETSD